MALDANGTVLAEGLQTNLAIQVGKRQDTTIDLICTTGLHAGGARTPGPTRISDAGDRCLQHRPRVWQRRARRGRAVRSRHRSRPAGACPRADCDDWLACTDRSAGGQRLPADLRAHAHHRPLRRRSLLPGRRHRRPGPGLLRHLRQRHGRDRARPATWQIAAGPARGLPGRRPAAPAAATIAIPAPATCCCRRAPAPPSACTTRS